MSAAAGSNPWPAPQKSEIQPLDGWRPPQAPIRDSVQHVHCPCPARAAAAAAAAGTASATTTSTQPSCRIGASHLYPMSIRGFPNSVWCPGARACKRRGTAWQRGPVVRVSDCQICQSIITQSGFCQSAFCVASARLEV